MLNPLGLVPHVIISKERFPFNDDIDNDGAGDGDGDCGDDGGGWCNLIPRVLSLPRESTLVMACHVSIHANYRRTEGGSSTNFNFNFNIPAPPFDHISGIC